MASNPTDELQYRPDIDGLRGIAVLAVVGYHAVPGLVRSGFIGVDVFFVISGYLISGIILDGLCKGSFTFQTFYARRIKRIFPALILVLVFCFGAGWRTLLPGDYEQLGKHMAGGAAFVSNFVLWREAGYFDKAGELKPLLHLWSLGIEEQFYLVWPLLLYVAWKAGVNFIVLIASSLLLSFGLNIHETRIDPVAAFYSPLTRFWELAIGSTFAYLRLFPPERLEIIVSKISREMAATLREVTAAAGMLLVSFSIVGLNAAQAFPGWWECVPTVGAALLIFSGPKSAVSEWVLSNRALVFVGLISYPLYLWHWPLLSYAHILGLGTSWREAWLCAVALSVVLATLTYWIVERPIRFGKKGQWVKVLCLVILMGAVGSVGLGTFEQHGLEFRMAGLVPQLVRLNLDYKTDARYGTCWLTSLDSGGKYAPQCLDKSGSGPLVVVWGDSHAARLYPGLRVVAGNQVRLAQYTRDACPPIVNLGNANCISANQYILNQIKAIKPATVILFAVWNQYDKLWTTDRPVAQKLLQTVAAVEEAGVSRILIIGPAPQWNDDLPRLLVIAARRDRLHRVPGRTSFGLDPLAHEVDEALDKLFGARKDVTYFSAWKAFCTAEGCLTRVSDDPDGLTTWDYGHLTTPAAEYLVQRLPLVDAPAAR